MCPAEGQVPEGYESSNTRHSPASPANGKSPRRLQPGSGVKHFNAAKRALAAKASANRRAKKSGNTTPIDAEAQQIIRKKHIYLIQKIDFDTPNQVHSGAKTAKSNDVAEQSSGDDYSDDDFDDGEGDGDGGGAADEDHAQLAGGDADTVAIGSQNEKRDHVQHPRQFCAWLGCTETVFDSTHPADMKFLLPKTGEPLHSLAYSLCGQHARAFTNLRKTKSGSKELRK